MADAHTSGDVGAIEVVVDDWCDARDGGVARGHLLNGLNLVLLGDLLDGVVSHGGSGSDIAHVIGLADVLLDDGV